MTSLYFLESFSPLLLLLHFFVHIIHMVKKDNFFTASCVVLVQVVLPSGKTVVDIEPQFDDIQKLPGRGLIITGLAPPESEFDFFNRFFCPKLGIKEVISCHLVSNHYNVFLCSIKQLLTSNI